MEYEKTQFFKMSHGTDCLAPPPATLQASAAATEATTALEGISTSTFRIGAVTNFFISTPAAASEAICPSITTPPGDPYSSYADNFDLSLLPQDCAATVDEHDIHGTKRNINCTPSTTGYEYNHNPRKNVAETPHIKIEQAWPQSNASGSPVNDIKQEAASSLHYEQGQPQYCHNLYQPHHQLQVPVKTGHQLIPPPPPPYPHAAYPSPQSSPAQSDYGFPQSLGFASPYESLSSSRSSLYHPSSPCPSLSDASVASSLIARVKQELHILPPSPPESSCETPSPQSSANTPFDIKSEPFDNDTEALVDLNALIEKEVAAEFTPKLAKSEEAESSKQDHQLLREYLEDNSFQKRHNLKPLALESFFGGLEEVHGDIEPVISLALENAKREADETCAKLQISQDPSVWTPAQVHAWLRSTIAQFKLPQIDNLEAEFCENGAALILVSEEEFVRRAPESGSFLHAQLEIWKLSFTDCYQMSPAEANSCLPTENEWCSPQYPLHTPMEDADDNDTDDEDDSTPSGLAGPLAEPNSAAHSTMDPKRANATATPKAGRTGGSHIHLWQFLKELLSQPHVNGTAIRWMDRSKGVFKIEDSVRVAKLWGKRKNRPAMNYDKLSRSIRQYYKKGIMKKTERSQRLVYQFCHPYHL